MKKITLALIIIFICNSTFVAKASVEEPIKKLLMDYINKINDLERGAKKNDVLYLFDEKYSGNTVYVNLSGALVRKNYDKKNISSQLDDIINDDNYSFRLTLDKIVFQNQKENAGIISAVVSFESFINKKLAEKGTMLMDMVGIQINERWRIVQNNMVRVSEAKDIGECVCYMYGNGDTKFVTEVYFPAGLEYDQKLESFQITRKDGVRLIKSHSEEFSWKGNGGIYYKGKSIGKTKDSKLAIQAAVKDLYKDSCINVVFN
ncbi:hypothetical protein D1818_16880 [Aquimarina sp. BL5]|uniref:hypothetical protein n=1 Tax=Aquimarina sp. BL5 TaxID=1714860 RepID=UPI000E4DA657|nr:hypothetical protein [Aquimarina sp. BL5]AXT52430.1 hypothetical protein D1818_16880 [Aquimarina sp. BL5]RKN05902.1 hypothetical protein D7036_09770 [Aquimarina sp. BL5]